jgi:hypothetical protein
MSKENGLSVIEMIFTILILTVIAVWSSSVFYNIQKEYGEKEELRKMQEKKNNIFRNFTINIANNFENITIENDKLKIHPTLNGCGNNENIAIYELNDNELLCNNKVIYNNIENLNYSLGYDDNGNGNIDSYIFNNSKNNGELKSITIELILESQKKYYNEKEQTFHTLNGEKNIISNKFLEIYRQSIIKKAY